ncbi:hypothetical protein [Lysinibacillus sp. FJAT-14222]|uniref:hypothetical protein n=1 Tax=Lysinibacillus sp. FJAT-14222 TaxID=1932366 RepID=UPI0011609AF6|nr:hypothetical protein [Lysinibacillus sp. FJAT-14222]
MTSILLAQAARRTPPGSFAPTATTNVLRKQSGSYNCFICAKAKRQQQSAQSERKSTTRFGDDQYFFQYC